MINIDSLKKCYESNGAMLLFFQGVLREKNDMVQYILNEEFINGAKAISIVNTLLAIKEDVIENVGNLQFDSIINKSCLDKAVSKISKITNDKKYIVDGMEFDSPEILLSTIRNKFAHGDYEIDFNTKEFIINIESSSVRIKINKMADMVIALLGNTLDQKKTNKEEEFVSVYGKLDNNKPLENELEIYNAIKKTQVIKFTLTKKDNSIIEQYILNQFYLYMRSIKDNGMDFHMINEMKSYFKKLECDVNVSYERLNNKKDISCVLNSVKNTLLSGKYSLDDQLRMILIEVKRKLHNKDSILTAHLNNVILLDAIDKYQSVNIDYLVRNITEEYQTIFYLNQNSEGAVLVNMFSSLFMIPFDKYYKGLEDNKDFDFSQLNLDSVNVLVDESNTVLFRTLRETLDSKSKSLDKIKMSINEVKNNYDNVLKNGNDLALSVISVKLDKLNEMKSNLINEMYLLKNDLYVRNGFYANNDLYIKNRNIIEGIRNSIAHGNVEVVRDNDKVYLLFNDIYEGKLTFSCQVEMNEFVKICDSSFELLIDYLEEKTKVM